MTQKKSSSQAGASSNRRHRKSPKTRSKQRPYDPENERRPGPSDYAAYFAKDLESRIRQGRHIPTEYLIESLSYLVDYPLSETILRYVSQRLRRDVRAKEAGERAIYENAWMLCIAIPRYEEIYEGLKKAQAERKRAKGPGKPSSRGRTDDPLREKAIGALRAEMKLRHMSPASWANKLSVTRRFAREHSMLDIIETCRALKPHQRQVQILRVMSRLQDAD